jgi:hypothetical protein
MAPSNNAFKLTRSRWPMAAWRHFVPPCAGGCGPSQLNAMFYGRSSTHRHHSGVTMTCRPYDGGILDSLPQTAETSRRKGGRGLARADMGFRAA